MDARSGPWRRWPLGVRIAPAAAAYAPAAPGCWAPPQTESRGGWWTGSDGPLPDITEFLIFLQSLGRRAKTSIPPKQGEWMILLDKCNAHPQKCWDEEKDVFEKFLYCSLYWFILQIQFQRKKKVAWNYLSLERMETVLEINNDKLISLLGKWPFFRNGLLLLLKGSSILICKGHVTT